MVGRLASRAEVGMLKQKSDIQEEAKRAAAEYIRQVNPIDYSMGWRLDDVLAAFLAGAVWRAVR